jgi:hypothetical protein
VRDHRVPRRGDDMNKLPPRAACGHFLLGTDRACEACAEAARRKQARPPVLEPVKRQAIAPATIENWVRRHAAGDSFGTIARQDGTVSSETVRVYVQRAKQGAEAP